MCSVGRRCKQCKQFVGGKGGGGCDWVISIFDGIFCLSVIRFIDHIDEQIGWHIGENFGEQTSEKVGEHTGGQGGEWSGSRWVSDNSKPSDVATVHKYFFFRFSKTGKKNIRGVAGNKCEK